MIPPVAAPAPPDTHKTFMCTDLGNAERLVARHGRDLRYVPPWRTWLVWDHRRWARDETLEVHRRAKDTVRAMWDEVARAEDADEKKRLIKHVVQSEADGKLRAMVARAQSELGIAVTPDQLDVDPMLLTVQNGILDLRTAELCPHSRLALTTKLVRIVYDPTATCPRWLAFLDRVLGGNAELIAFLQRAIGYSLTARTDEQCLFFLYGFGANGKTTFLEVLRALAGEYATQADFTTFLDRKSDGPRNDIARLFGARVVTSSEVGEGKRLNESLVKTLTGSDIVAARYLYAEAFEFRPTFKLWLAANHRPVIRGQDHGIWRRIRLVPFTVQIPASEQDRLLGDALRDELPGILAWAIDGCQAWLEQGLGTPVVVQEATEAYRRDSDTLGAFLDECCELGALYSVRAAELYAAYTQWCTVGGEYQLSSRKFANQLEERGITSELRGRDRDRVTWRVGIRVLDHARAMPRDRGRGGPDGPGSPADAQEDFLV